jgi:hypothetical protein
MSSRLDADVNEDTEYVEEPFCSQVPVDWDDEPEIEAVERQRVSQGFGREGKTGPPGFFKGGDKKGEREEERKTSKDPLNST